MTYKGWDIEEGPRGWYIAYPQDCDEGDIIEKGLERIKFEIDEREAES